MLIGYKEVRKELRAVWPKLKHIWLDQSRYWIPALKDVKKAISLQDVRDMKFIQGIRECEAFARSLHNKFHEHVIKKAESYFNHGNVGAVPESLKYTWAFGFARGLNVETTMDSGPHALNFAVTQEGVYLFEPQTYQVVRPTRSRKEKDGNFIYFVTI